MSFGRLGTGVLAAGNEQTIYQVPVNSVGAIVNINVLNPSAASDATVEVSIVASGNANAAADEFIEKGVILAAKGGTLENTGLIVGPGEKVNVKSDIAGVVVRVSGEEKASL